MCPHVKLFLYEFDNVSWGYMTWLIIKGGNWLCFQLKFKFVERTTWYSEAQDDIEQLVCVFLLLYSQVCEENWWIGAVWLDILHGVPLVHAELVGWDPALVVADPGQEQAAWVVIMAASHLACFVKRLQGWPDSGKNRKKIHTWEVVSQDKNKEMTASLSWLTG